MPAFIRILVLLGGLCLCTALPVSAAAPEIRAAVALGQHSIEITVPEGGAVLLDGRKAPQPLHPDRVRTVLSADKTGFRLGKTVLAGKSITITAPQNATVEVNRRRYRGAITILRTAGATPALDVINTLALEQYLYGVVPQEMPASWPKEALKAQAVAARSFALALKEANRLQLYDVKASVSSQVYGGFLAEEAATNKVVDETRGLVIAYAGRCVPGYYHSVSGGYTETSEAVWGSPKPYLQAVADVVTKAPQEKWERTFSPEVLDRYLTQAGLNIGKLQAIRLSPLVGQPVRAADRSTSGRVTTLRLVGSNGEASLEGSRLRQLLQLPSTLFDVAVVSEVPKEIAATITDSYGNPVAEKKIPVQVGDQSIAPLWSDAKDVRRISRGTGVMIRFFGRGFGHGVGMSQWGAKTIAEQAKPDDPAIFRTILQKYYPGVALMKAYED